MSEMYPRSTAFRGAVESAGGLKKYCGTTNGSIEFVDNTRGGMVRVNAHALARVFVESRGGRVTASEFGKFYDHLGEARLTMKALVGKVKTALCANHGAGLVWEDEDDKEIGFGYIRCVTPPTSSCTSSPSRSSPVETSLRLPITWPVYNYIQTYLKGEIDGVVSGECDSVCVELQKIGKNAYVVFALRDRGRGSGRDVDSEGSDDDRSDALGKCSRAVEDYLDTHISCIPPLKFCLSREDILDSECIRCLQNEHQVLLYVTKPHPETDREKPNKVVMEFPGKWASAGKSCVVSPVERSKQRIAQYLMKEFHISRDMYSCTVELKPSPRAIVSLFELSSLQEVMSTERSKGRVSDGVRFSGEMDRSQVTVVYRTGKKAGADHIIDCIGDLERVTVEITDLFPSAAYLKSSFFFGPLHWPSFNSQLESSAGLSSVSVEVKDNVVRISGPKRLVTRASSLLRARAEALLYREIPIPDNMRDSFLREVLPSVIQGLSRRMHAQGIEGGEEEGMRDGDEGSLVSGKVESSDACSSLAIRDCTSFAIHVNNVQIVGSPESCSFWQHQCEAVEQLLASLVCVEAQRDVGGTELVVTGTDRDVSEAAENEVDPLYSVRDGEGFRQFDGLSLLGWSSMIPCPADCDDWLSFCDSSSLSTVSHDDDDDMRV